MCHGIVGTRRCPVALTAIAEDGFHNTVGGVNIEGWYEKRRANSGVPDAFHTMLTLLRLDKIGTDNWDFHNTLMSYNCLSFW